MVGENFDLGSPPTGYEFGEVALVDRGRQRRRCLAVPDYSVVDRLSLDVRAGEIVCIYGLMGAGRTELLECVAGRLPSTRRPRPARGRGRLAASASPSASRAGLVLVPEDRQRDGLVQTMTVGANLSLASIGAFAKGLFLSRSARAATLIDDSIRNVHIKTDGGGAPIGSLSGGNQQKVVIGKMLATNPQVILLDEPSRGIDIGAKAEVFRLLGRARQRRASRSSSRPRKSRECLSIAHRIIVMRRGRISAEFGSDVTKEKIMAASGEAVVAH